MTLKQVVKCYDTLTGTYVDVPVIKEVEEYIKRSYWREDMQERRYYKRVINIDDYQTKSEDVFMARQKLLEEIVKQEEQVYIAQKLCELSEKQQMVVQLVYVEENTMTAAAAQMHVSVSYVSRLLKEARNRLAVLLELDL